MQGSFQEKEALANIFAQIKDVDEEIFGDILKILRKQKVEDCIGFLSNIGNQRQLESQIQKQLGNFTPADIEWKFSFVKNDIKQITEVLSKLKDHDFNKIDYSFEENEESTQSLINSIKDFRWIIEFLQFLVHLTSIDETFIQGGSNSLHMLVKMKVDLSNKSLENIKIQNTSLVGANFVRCNFSGSQFNNVDIGGLNLNEAVLLNCNWKNLRILELNQLHGHSDYVRSVCFSPDGKTLASGSHDKSIRLWDVKTGQQKAKLNGHSSDIYNICFSPDGNTLASGSQDYSIRLWDVKSKKKIAKLDAHSYAVMSVCFSPDGNTLASGSWDKSIRLWDVKTGQQIAKLDGHSYGVYSVCFSPDGNTLASGSWDKSIRLWDVKTGQSKAQLDGHSSRVWSVCFSPDGNTLASGSWDKSIRLWDVKTGQQKAKLDGHDNWVMSVCFSPNKNTLASGSDDKSIRLWDVKTGQQKEKLDGHSDCINQVCFSPDGDTLASSSYDKSIRLWDVKTRQEIKSSDKNYKDILAQSKIPLQSNSPILEASNYITTLLNSEKAIFQAKGALILKGEFINQSGIDLKTLFKQKGSCFLEDQQQK